MTGGADQHNPRSARCVVWHEPGHTLDPELSRALSKRPEFHVVRCESAFAALAEVCRMPTATANRPHTVLLLVQPDRLDAGEVLSLLPRYAPEAHTWRFDAHATPKLSAYLAEPKPAPRAEPAIVTRPLVEGVVGASRVKMPPAPKLRLTGECPAEARPCAEPKFTPLGTSPGIRPDATPEPEPPPAVPDASRLLTDEELAMLLGSDETQQA